MDHIKSWKPSWSNARGMIDMIKLAAIFFLSYMFGHGHFTSYRPQLLDRPLVEFHRTVNIVAADMGIADKKMQRAFEPSHIIGALRNHM